MNVLLTGASGFLGRIINNFLIERGAAIIGLDRSTQAVNIDITKPFVLDANLDIEIVVHAAGKAHVVPRTLEEEQAFFDVNLEGTKNLCLALDKLVVKPKAFIFISTVAVYGLDAGENILESQPLNGVTPYAKSKIQAEQFLNAWAQKKGIVLGIIRLPLIAGPNPPGNLGAMINGIRLGRYFSIGKANARKSMVWVEDVALIIPRLAEVGGTFNLTDGYHPSFHELEKEISKLLNKRGPAKIPFWVAQCLGHIGDLFRRFPINSSKLKKITSSLTFSDNKACKMLGWKPSRVLSKLPEIL